MKAKTPQPSKLGGSGWTAIALLILVLALLFWRSFLPGLVHFSNDGPLGQQNAAAFRLPGALTGMWSGQNGLGLNTAALPLSLTTLIRWVLGLIPFAKFFPAVALFIVGVGAWVFFRALKFSHGTATLGALAAMLNSTFFSNTCWGVAQQQIALGMNFCALALIAANHRETPWKVRWMRLALAGLCVGMNIMESMDIGALYSLIIAAFAFYKALVEQEGHLFIRAARGVGRVAVVAIFAGFLAAQTVSSLIGSQIQGIAGTQQTPEIKAQHWDQATQWSLPKRETLGLLVPGLFGYRMDTPKDIMPMFQNTYYGGFNWGGVGRPPEVDRYLDDHPSSTAEEISKHISAPYWRFTSGENYGGVLVFLVAFWAVAQSLRRQHSLFSREQKAFIWFWGAVMIISLPLAWGRFAPGSESPEGWSFYALLYKLPYFSTIRNPDKFLIFLSWALVILFGYGIHGLTRQMNPAAPKTTGGLAAWWARASQFDRRWVWACVGVLAASLVAWLVFQAERPAFIQYLQKVGFFAGPDDPGATQANLIASFSYNQIGWFLALLAVAIGLLTLVLSGYFQGPRAKTGMVLLGAFLVFDLGRANIPYIVHWDYRQKYEIGTLNPIETFLLDRPYEHRVAKLLAWPLSTPGQFDGFNQLYEIEWKQHHFPYYGIQGLDVVQMPRMPEDIKAYSSALSLGGKQDDAGRHVLDEATFPRMVRSWELSNTRYLLGPAGFVSLFNEKFDPGQGRFRIVQRFTVALKPDVAEFHHKFEELTAYATTNGEYALIEFTGALPRAKLYGNWLVETNDEEVLRRLADPKFDPAQTVLVSTPLASLPAVGTNANTGTVAIKSYEPKRVVLATQADTLSVLLLNDRYDPNWRVSVDGQPAVVLRCNYLMRGVAVPPGAHTVEFFFQLPLGPFYVTLAALVTTVLLCIGLWVATRKKAVAPTVAQP